MNEFLRTRQQITESTQWLNDNGYISHPISCKDYELKQVVERLEDGDLVDLGADGSFVLHNSVIKNTKGRKVGIDLIEVTGTNKAEGAEYFKGDLHNTGLEDYSFDMIVSLSTIEHQVHIGKFALECNRLLRSGGKVIVSFDYWTPKPDTSLTKLYSLDWNILDKEAVIYLVREFAVYHLRLTSEIDWTTQDAVINDTYCSPAQGVSYTFGILEFIKQ